MLFTVTITHEIVIDACNENEAVKKTIENMCDIIGDSVSTDFDFDAIPFTEMQPIRWDSRCFPYGRNDKKTIGEILNGL